jgi:CheY-like chemotaxis protein
MKFVMIVDDEPGVTKIVSSFLLKHSYEAIVAANGMECVARMRTGFHGVVLMDVAMPKLDGWQTIRTLKDENLLGQCLVCMLTGLEPAGCQVGLEGVVFDYLLKPFTLEALSGVLSSAFELLQS